MKPNYTELQRLAGVLWDAKQDVAFQRSQAKGEVKEMLHNVWIAIVTAQGKLNLAMNAIVLEEQ